MKELKKIPLFILTKASQGVCTFKQCSFDIGSSNIWLSVLNQWMYLFGSSIMNCKVLVKSKYWLIPRQVKSIINLGLKMSWKFHACKTMHVNSNTKAAIAGVYLKLDWHKVANVLTCIIWQSSPTIWLPVSAGNFYDDTFSYISQH